MTQKNERSLDERYPSFEVVSVGRDDAIMLRITEGKYDGVRLYLRDIQVTDEDAGTMSFMLETDAVPRDQTDTFFEDNPLLTELAQEFIVHTIEEFVENEIERQTSLLKEEEETE